MNSLYTIFRFSNKTKNWSRVFEHEDIDRIWLELTVLASDKKMNKLNCFIIAEERDGHINFPCCCEEYFKFADIERLTIRSGLSIIYEFKNKKAPVLSEAEEKFTKQITNEINLWLVNEHILINDIYIEYTKKMKKLGIKRNFIKLFKYSFLKSQYYPFMRDMIKSEIKRQPENRGMFIRIWERIHGERYEKLIEGDRK